MVKAVPAAKIEKRSERQTICWTSCHLIHCDRLCTKAQMLRTFAVSICLRFKLVSLVAWRLLHFVTLCNCDSPVARAGKGEKISHHPSETEFT